MRKLLLGTGMLLALAVCVLGGVVAGASLGGGVPAGSFLADVPGMERLVGTRSTDTAGKRKETASERKKADADENGKMAYLDMAAPEALRKMVRDLEERVKEVNNREERLARKQKELKAWKKALKEKRKKLTALAKKKKKRLTKLKKQVQRRRKKLKEQKISMSTRRRENLEQAAKIYNRMDAARAAGTLMRLYRQGKEETAVKIIYLMKDRNAAEVLGSMRDEEVSVEITRRLAHVSQESE